MIKGKHDISSYQASGQARLHPGAQVLGKHCGQAMVEFVVALIGIMVLLAGLIQIGLLTLAHTETMIDARREAAESAMAETYSGSPDDRYIFDWFVGTDGKSYTRDDVPFTPTNVPESTQDIITAAHSDELASYIPDNAFSRIEAAPSPVDEFFLVHGHAEQTLSTFPVIRNLIYRRSTISTESDVWLVWTKGIY